MSAPTPWIGTAGLLVGIGWLLADCVGGRADSKSVPVSLAGAVSMG